MYKPKFFNIKEMVSEYTYLDIKHRGDDWAWATLFDPRLLYMMDLIRTRFGKMMVNDWYWGGNNIQRGFRNHAAIVGSRLSQHRFGRAVDLVPVKADVEDIRAEILTYPTSARYHHIGGLELDVPWLHLDVRSRPSDGMITVFRP